MLGGIFRRDELRSVGASEILAAINSTRMGGPTLDVSDPDKAMRHSAVWACVRLIAGVGSTLPLDQYRQVGDQRVPSPLAPVFTDPAPGVSTTTWLHQLWSSLLLTGNAYGLVTELGTNGYPRRVEVIDPGCVQWAEQNGTYVAKVDGKVLDRWPMGPLFHIAWFAPPGKPFGLSPITHAATTIGAGLAAEEFGGRFFADGAHPSAIIYSESDLSREQAEGVKTSFTKAVSGTSREPAVMGAGLRYERIQINPNESQFLDSQRLSAEHIARIYGVFPEMIGAASSGSSVTYANREQRAADWLTFGMIPYLVPVEEALSSLIPRPQRVRSNVSALLRSDLLTRYQSYEIGIRSGFLVPNEARDLEDRPPLPGGDVVSDPTPPPPAPSPAPPEVQQ